MKAKAPNIKEEPRQGRLPDSLSDKMTLNRKKSVGWRALKKALAAAKLSKEELECINLILGAS